VAYICGYVMKSTNRNKWGLAAAAAVSFALAPAGNAQDAVAKGLKGYWSIDKAKMIEAAVAEAEASGSKFEGPEAEMAKKMIGMMAEMVVVHFQDGGKVTAFTPEGPDEATYAIEVTDAKAGVFKLTLDAPDEEPKTGKAKITGDKMELQMDDDPQTMHMVRVSDTDAEARKKKIADFDPSSLFAPPGGSADSAPDSAPAEKKAE
jgi:hypothetical protein